MNAPVPGGPGRPWLAGGLALALALGFLLLAPAIALAQVTGVQVMGVQPNLALASLTQPAVVAALSLSAEPSAAASAAPDRVASPPGSSRDLPSPARPQPAIDAPAGSQSGRELSLPRLFDQALTASREGRFGDALPLWDQVLELAPEDASAWSNRGNVLLALGDAEAAIAAQDRAMLLDPVNADPHLNRGTAEEALGRWGAAAADYHWVLERDPADASALYNLGNVAGSLGDWAAARDCFSQAALARPGFAMARSSAALAAFQQGDLPEAERELRNLIRRYPLFADARAGLTALLWSKGARGEAESHWAAASGLDPRYRQGEWLQQIRRWPPGPIQALDQFLRLAS
jgi:tetratricopeptide (TPR) repeat protein